MNENNLLNIAAFSPKSLQFPNAWVGHLPFAAWLIREVSPKIFVELGTHSGNSYFAFCQSAVEGGLSTKCFAVDTWQGDIHAGEYADDIFTKVDSHNYENYIEFSRLMRMTFDNAVNYFADESIDLLHIDGLHTYEAVRNDFETWLPKLKPGALVIFHDTNVRERGFGVWKLWAELQARYPNNIEFVHSHGLGVLQLDNAPDSKVLEWLQPNSLEKQRLINYFAALGSRQLERFELNELKTLAAKLNQTVAERDGQIASLTQASAKLDGQIASLTQAKIELDEQIASLNQNLAEIFNSTSWRVTRPMRKVAYQFKRARRVMELGIPAIKLGGGLKNTLKKAFRLYRREGLAGIRRGFKIVATSGQVKPASASGEYDRNDYVEWVRRYDTLTDETYAVIRASIEAFEHQPLVSVVMPVYNPKSEWLIEAIESVRRQIYTNWELCIADDASSKTNIRPILEHYASEDPRIKVIFRAENGHISAASNSALSLASGEFIALLDNDDLLPAHALFHVANAILSNTDAALIYSDEDKINEMGERYDPYFKCKINYELLLAQNMVCHLGVYRRDLLEQIHGFRVGFEGAQDYDLVLRVLEKIKFQQVVHIPKVLYHWRAIPGSTALDAGEKNYAAEAARKAISEHLTRTGRGGIVTAAPEAPSLNRVRYSLPEHLPLVSIVIPTRDRVDLLSMCLESLLTKTTYQNFEVIVVDNGSVEENTKQFFAKLPKKNVSVIRDDSPFNYSRLNNLAVNQSLGAVVCLMNNDIEILTPDWLEEMLSFAIQPDIGCVGARLWYPDGRLQHGGVILGVGGISGHAHKYLPKLSPGYFGRAVLHQSLSAVTGACLMLRRSVWEEVSGLDENLAVAFNDVDLCLRVREKGYRNVWTPFAEMNHHESSSRGAENTYEKKSRFKGEINLMKNRWGRALFEDPAYSPNLTLEIEDFSYSWNY